MSYDPLKKQLTAEIALEVGCHESLVRMAYKDSSGVWTWSIGLTSATGHSVERYIGKPQSMEHCIRVYVWALDNYADDVRRFFDGVPLTQQQFAGALSFHWNTGLIHKATWAQNLKDGNRTAAKKNIMNWTKSKGEVVQGLVKRRKREQALIFNGVWANDGFITEWTRLHSNYNPDWKSGVRRNIRPLIEDAFRDVIPDSDKVIVERETPVLSPKVEELAKDEAKKPWHSTTIVSAIVAALGGVGASLKAAMDAMAGSGNALPWAVCGGVVVIAAVWIIKERMAKARRAQETLDEYKQLLKEVLSRD